MSTEREKQVAAQAAATLVEPSMTVGLGTGTTVAYLLPALAARALDIRCAATSPRTEEEARALGLRVEPFVDIDRFDIAIDGADQIDPDGWLIKGGGGALTREKIVAAAAARFICIIDESKLVGTLGAFPLPIEVIPMARNLIARRLEARGARPVWRRGFITDNGNHILDVHGLSITDPVALERELNQITGIVTVGLFAARPADVLIIGTAQGVEQR